MSRARASTPAASGPMIALRGAMLGWRGDPFVVGDARARRHESDAIVAMAGGRIVHAGPAGEVARRLPPGTPVERLPRDALMLPGFVDCHVHYPQLPVIGSYGAELLDWLARYTFPAEARFADAGLARRVARAFLGESLRQGTTTAAVFCTVHPGSVDAFMREAHAAGARMIAGKVLMDRHAPRTLRDSARRGYDESKALIGRWHGRGRLGYAITPRFAATSTPAQLDAAGALWREHPSCWVQSHVSENRAEIAWVRELFPRARDYVDVYARHGLLGRRAIFGHGIHLSAREWRALHASGTAIAHCPTSNLFLGSGLFRWDRALAPGREVAVGLATDVGGGTTLSMLRTMGAAYQVARMAGSTLTATRLLWLATAGGARALDLGEHIGALAPGQEADLVVLDLASTPLAAQRTRGARDLEEALFAQMTLGSERAVRATWVAGRKLFDRDADEAARGRALTPASPGPSRPGRSARREDRMESGMRFIAAAVAAACLVVAGGAWAADGGGRPDKQAKQPKQAKQAKTPKSGTATVQRSKGADGATDRVVTGPGGRTQTIDRSRGADGATDATITGRKGGTTTVDRSKGADGVTDRVVTGPGGATQTIDRTRGSDGAIDSTITGRKGGTTSVDRSKGADGLTDRVVTGPGGATQTIDRTRGADGAVDATITGPKGTSTVDRSKGADGLTDRVVTGPGGATQTIDRTRGADGAVDATITGRKGGTTTVDRSRGTDGVTDRVVTGPGGATQTIDRTRGTDGAIDSTITGRKGGTTTVDRSRNADGTTNATITRP